jgi:hypothetical protein
VIVLAGIRVKVMRRRSREEMARSGWLIGVEHVLLNENFNLPALGRKILEQHYLERQQVGTS